MHIAVFKHKLIPNILVLSRTLSKVNKSDVYFD